MNNRQGSIWVVLVVVAICFQGLFIAGDRNESPGRVVADFTDAYYRYDASMADYMANGGVSDDNVNLVDSWIDTGTENAHERGFDLSMLKSKIYDVRTYTSDQTADSAKVRITAERRTSINPVFFVVGKLFHLGETHELDAEVDVVKENGHWRVIGKPFQLASL